MVTPALLNLQLRLTRRCNLRCTHCYTSSLPELQADYFPLTHAKRIISEAIPLGLKFVTLIGGEPLIYPQFDELVEYIASLPDITIELETNGLLLHRHRTSLSRFPRKFAVEISIDGQATRGIKETELAFKALEIDMPNATKCVQTLCSYNNLHSDFFDICEKVSSMKVDQVIFMGPSGCGRGSDMTYLSWEDCKLAINRLNKIGGGNIRVELPPLITKSEISGCGWNTYRLEILPNGDTSPCVQGYYAHPEQMNVGDAFTTPLEDLWLNNTRLSAIRSISQRDMDGPCKTCTYWSGCYGSCRAWSQSWDESQKWTGSYLRCEEFLSDEQLPIDFSVPHKSIHLLKLPWIDGKYDVR